MVSTLYFTSSSFFVSNETFTWVQFSSTFYTTVQMDHPKNQFLERLNLECQCFMISARGGFEDTKLEAKDRPSRGQGHRRKCSPKKKVFKIFFRRKRSSKIFFGRSLLEETKKRSLQIFREVSGVFQRNFNRSKIVLSSSRGQTNFWGLEASRPRQGLQNVSSRPRTSSRTPPLISADI